MDEGSVVECFGEPIHIYTREEAIRDGVLVPVGTTRLVDGTPVSICFTANLHADTADENACADLIRRGLRMLNEPDPEDGGHRRLRVVEEGRIWTIWDGDGITFLRPEDY